MQNTKLAEMNKPQAGKKLGAAADTVAVDPKQVADKKVTPPDANGSHVKNGVEKPSEKPSETTITAKKASH